MSGNLSRRELFPFVQLLSLDGVRVADDRNAPTDQTALNAFAGCYNDYVSRLQAGIVDLRAWKRVQEAGRKLGL